MKKDDIVVVIPVYRSMLVEDEYLSLAQCMRILSNYSIVLVKPESLDVSFITSEFSSLSVESFPDQYFVSLRAYNKLVLDEKFYLRFLKYQYMLIYQLDAYVFKDELLFWANKEYDYIGAPWIPWNYSHLTRLGRLKILIKRNIYAFLNKKKYKSKKYCNFQVGNGGFSLRRINKMIEVVSFYKEKINYYLDDNKSFYPEDVFLLLEITSRKYRLHRPRFKEALRFSMEENPAWAYNFNKQELPFGCHDWNHDSYKNFWLPIIKPK